ncbi:MAG TPA: DUF4226 domain-containing protein [Mycobacterium sp.]|nr:DUF4226 domain-containing protein [Mycobacterium sp.]
MAPGSRPTARSFTTISANHNNWVQNADGTVCLQNPDGSGGPAIKPTGYRPTSDGKYTPVDDRGNQIAPLTGGMPLSDHGFYTDPRTGVLTPKSAKGDYYTFDPATGQRQFFNSDGQPISEQQFNNGQGAGHDGQPPAGRDLPTDEQQSGRAADAVRKLHEELKKRYSQLSDAEEKLSEALLNAHATTAVGQQKLNAIRQKIVEAVNNPALPLDTPAGEQAFLKFLRTQVAAIGDVLRSGTLSAEDQSKTVAALSNLYALDQSGATDPSTTPASGQPCQPATPADPAPAAAPLDPGPGAEESMPDPAPADLGLGGLGGPVGPDPLSPLASALPAALGGLAPLGGLGSMPLDSLGGLAGIPASLPELASPLGDQPRHDNTSDKPGEKADEASDTKHKEPQDKTAQEPAQQPAGAGQPQPSGTPGEGAASGAAAPAPVALTSVTLPDGSTANARTPALAQAVSGVSGRHARGRRVPAGRYRVAPAGALST